MRDFHSHVSQFSDLQIYLKDLYGNVNQKKSWDYLFGYLSRHCGFMTVNAARGDALPAHFVRALSWLFALGNKVGVDITNAYVKRFPGRCYYCLSAPCCCRKTGKQPLNYVPAYRIPIERGVLYDGVVSTLRKYQEVVNFKWLSHNVSTIYPNNEVIWFHSGPWFHFTKLFGELSELHQALSKHEIGEDKTENLAEELADVFAWMISIWQLEFPTKDLQDEFITYFYNGCPVCGSKPCKCSPRSERRSGIVSVAELESLHRQVSDLAEKLGDRQEELADIRKSLQLAIESKSEQVAVQAVAQTKDKMRSLKDSINSIDETGKKAMSLVETISNLATKLLGLVEIVRNIT